MDRRPPDGGPIRAFRDRYVAAFSGVSYDLAPGSVGVHPEHIGDAEEILGRKVLVSHEGGAVVPMWLRPAFQVVPLTRLMRNAREVAWAGGVVFSSFDLDEPETARVLTTLGVGDAVFLNASVDRLPEASLRRPFQDEPSAA